ncbi:MAG TPA: pyridoxamine 5'-phosphate oxidase family protein [Chloroflexota bacterium]|nr:pyridoxamine 5'-phosphate oxidase family protein [Chloroflexota bacterium]
MERSAYQGSVPAVVRAVKALEHLASAQQPLSLSTLARTLDVGPSSLLAILATLKTAGLVSRSPRDGRYSPGPGLVALGTAAAQRLEPLQTFDGLAADLVERLGETVLLWVHQGDGLALAAAREGQQPLRYVPPLGLRPPAGGWASQVSGGVVEGELEPDVWMLAASLDERSVLAIVGPTGRLRGAAGTPAREALRKLADGDSAWGSSGPIQATELNAFLDQALVASLSYLSRDGYPSSVPLWYDWDGSAFWLVPSPDAEWAEHVRRNPRVSLAISESTAPLRRVLARGPIVAVDDLEDPDASQWRSVEGRLAGRYARLDAARMLVGRPRLGRVLLRLVPERLIAWRGLVRPSVGGGTIEARVARTEHLA